MKIGELARRSGLSAHTIRYYERIGLLPYADRDGGRRRDYDASILDWIAFLGKLKATGMPIRDMLLYAAWRQQGPVTNKDRRTLLEAHREGVRAQIADLSACLTVLDSKIATYRAAEERTEDHEPDDRHEPAAARPRSARSH
ncbi:MerR family transcriptional regulator [Xaviernesmea oryzae]|uniref:MerR family transcriptional regulator n=1 Tax=Xaviernesmea oryzae TaxID=464029 RepID=A0A1Q9AVM1_9HYPH|nr:MerR family transcriptional regulator [Xaviernesmea oryzae]OLP59464.1 MerR family transcriptional regulator [Xaviernesmea oryzae]SEL58976.1 DNA-binding transcriptional regulator, MerR family [Xaviernesmea oryzae]